MAADAGLYIATVSIIDDNIAKRVHDRLLKEGFYLYEYRKDNSVILEIHWDYYMEVPK